MIRYWFKFDLASYEDAPFGVIIGCGVTGYNYNDAVKILKEKVFKNGELPNIKNVIENVNIQDLDQNHVIPNMEPPNRRGVWFPLGYKF